jgi:deltex-like protein
MLIGNKEWFKCPVCSMIYGKMIGDQPPGAMNVHVNKLMRCEGYPDTDTIVIEYRMHSGKRGDISFPGTGRTAYLPNTIEGNEVLTLLREAFDRKLIFTIGRSVTTGRDNQIVWNGIHHKTNLSGGSAYFGYPDPTYFDRVKLELAAKGVF